jgi:hypothetical protein
MENGCKLGRNGLDTCEKMNMFRSQCGSRENATSRITPRQSPITAIDCMRKHTHLSWQFETTIGRSDDADV